MFQPLFLSTKRHLVRRFDANFFVAARMRLTEGVGALTGTDRPPVAAVVTGEGAPLPGTAGFAGAWRTLHGVAAQRLGLPVEAVLYAPFGRARCTRPAGPLLEDLSETWVERPSRGSEERTLHDAEGTFRVAVERIGGETPERSAVWGAVFSEPFDRETLERLCTEFEGATLARRRATEGGVTGDFLWIAAPRPTLKRRALEGRREALAEVAAALLAQSEVREEGVSLTIRGAETVASEVREEGVSLTIRGAETVAEAERIAAFLATHGARLRPDDFWRALVTAELPGFEWNRIAIASDDGVILKNGVWHDDALVRPAASLTIHLCRGHCGWRGTITQNTRE